MSSVSNLSTLSMFFFQILNLNAFRYECFGGFCDTKLNQFCNYRLEIQSCEECTPSVCAEDGVPPFCAEHYCPGLITPNTTDPTNHGNAQAQSVVWESPFFWISIFASLVVIVSVTYGIIVTRKLRIERRERSEKDGKEKENKEPLLKPQATADGSRNFVIDLPDKDEDETDKETGEEPRSPNDSKKRDRNPIEDYIISDTNEGRNGPTEMVNDAASKAMKIDTDYKVPVEDSQPDTEREATEPKLPGDPSHDSGIQSSFQ